MALAVDGDRVLLHDLQQGGLGLGRGAVDLVGQEDGGEDGARVELPLMGLLVEDGHARDVAGQQVGGELDPRVRPGYDGRHGPGQGGLAGPGGFSQNLSL